MFAGIESAQDYILVQFYIIHDDNIGREFKKRLERKAREGVRVYVLYDEIGSYNLPKAYRRELAEAGGVILPFRTSKGLRNRFQINFRNHRKIVVIDGDMAFVGGMNVADAYLGEHPRLGKWRDTHVEVSGPVVQAIQFAFLEDWYLGHGRRARAGLDAATGGRRQTAMRSRWRPTRRTCWKRAGCFSCTRSTRPASGSGSPARISCPICR